MAGRPPKPTALKVLQGNPGKRPLPADEPKPEVGATMPAWLMTFPAARQAWKKWAPILEGLGVLTEVDANGFARLCYLWAEFEQRVVSGFPSESTKLSEIRQLEGRFGLNPSDRAKIHVGKQEKKSKLQRFRGARQA